MQNFFKYLLIGLLFIGCELKASRQELFDITHGEKAAPRKKTIAQHKTLFDIGISKKRHDRYFSGSVVATGFAEIIFDFVNENGLNVVNLDENLQHIQSLLPDNEKGILATINIFREQSDMNVGESRKSVFYIPSGSDSSIEKRLTTRTKLKIESISNVDTLGSDEREGLDQLISKLQAMNLYQIINVIVDPKDPTNFSTESSSFQIVPDEELHEGSRDLNSQANGQNNNLGVMYITLMGQIPNTKGFSSCLRHTYYIKQQDLD